MTELSFRGYDVVAVSAYIASERDPEPLVRVGFAQGMNFASAERGELGEEAFGRMGLPAEFGFRSN